MDSTFSRALFGFIALTCAIIAMAVVALWSIDTFTDGVWWASIMVVLVALVVEIGVYSSTLHAPIYRWIGEPQRLADEERTRRADEQRAANRCEAEEHDQNNPPLIHEDKIG